MVAKKVLVTGPTGNVGGGVIRSLGQARDVELVAGVRKNRRQAEARQNVYRRGTKGGCRLCRPSRLTGRERYARCALRLGTTRGAISRMVGYRLHSSSTTNLYAKSARLRKHQPCRS